MSALPDRATILVGDVLARLADLPDESVHCVVTSPPYFSMRDYGVPVQIGLEARMDCLGWATFAPCGECHVCVMVRVFREVRRVLRRDGTCWMNYGDCYACAPNGRSAADTKAAGNDDRTFRDKPRVRYAPGVKPKDLCMMPHRVALALQADGWWVRSDIVWAKPNCMPESVTDRPTKAHEYIFLLARSERYYYNAEAVKETAQDWGIRNRESFRGGTADPKLLHRGFKDADCAQSGRNKRSVWTVPTFSFSEAHFATFPPDLIRPCILAGTSERGVCPACGAPWLRQVKREDKPSSWKPGNPCAATIGRAFNKDHGQGTRRSETAGWQPGCKCNAGEPEPAIVLDPFMGSGTTVMVALEYGRKGVGIELNEEYVALARRRIAPALAQEPLRL